MPRRRPPAADPLVQERVGRLLVRPLPTGGWVPPEDVTDDLPEPDDDPPDDPEPVAARSWSPRPEPAEDGPARRGLLPVTLAGGRLDPGHRGALALLLVGVLAAVVAAAVVVRGRPQEVAVPAVQVAGEPLPGASPSSPAPPSPAPTELVVAVAGQVAAPGLVRLPAGSRVDDAVQAAGGLAPGGSLGLLNLARPLQDGEQVVVGPEAGPDPPAAGPASGGAGGPAAGGVVDLNRATAAELDGLPGIGPVLAERIVAWRTENGGFASVDQLREVPGIGEAKYAVLEPEVRV